MRPLTHQAEKMSERGKSRWIYVELRLSLYLYFRNSLGDNLMSITSRILPYKMKIAEQRRAEYRAWHDREFATQLPNDAKRSRSEERRVGKEGGSTCRSRGE